MLTGDEGNDHLIGGAGNDSAFGGGGHDFMFGDGMETGALGLGNSLGVMFGTGAAGDDELHGGGSNDMLSGGAGIDELFGDNGDDIVVGGGDGDILTGGDGDDLFAVGLRYAAFGEDDDDGYIFGEGGGFAYVTDYQAIPGVEGDLVMGDACYQQGDDTVVTLNGQTVLILLDYNCSVDLPLLVRPDEIDVHDWIPPLAG